MIITTTNKPRLTSEQPMARTNWRRQIADALLAAFPTELKLAQMVSYGLDTSLDRIARSANLEERVFELIQWAEARGKLRELVTSAHEENPDNPALRRLVEQIDQIVAELDTPPEEPSGNAPIAPAILPPL